MNPWQFEQISDPRKPIIDAGPRARIVLERDERERGNSPELPVRPSVQPSIVDDGE